MRKFCHWSIGTTNSRRISMAFAQAGVWKWHTAHARIYWWRVWYKGMITLALLTDINVTFLNARRTLVIPYRFREWGFEPLISFLLHWSFRTLDPYGRFLPREYVASNFFMEICVMRGIRIGDLSHEIHIFFELIVSANHGDKFYTCQFNTEEFLSCQGRKTFVIVLLCLWNTDCCRFSINSGMALPEIIIPAQSLRNGVYQYFCYHIWLSVKPNNGGRRNPLWFRNWPDDVGPLITC